MQCTKCGTENAESSRFCVLCGHELLSLQADKILPYETNSPIFKQENKDKEIVEKESIYVALDTHEYNQMVTPDAQIVAPRKGFPKWIIPAIIGVVVILLGVLAFLLYPNIKMAVVGPEKYYAISEKVYIQEQSNFFTKYLKANTDSPLSLNFDCRFSAENLNSVYPGIEELFNKSEMQFSMDNNPDSNQFQNTLIYKYDNEEVLNLLTQEKNGKMAITFPGLSDKKMVSDTVRGYSKMLAKDEVELQKMTGLTQSELEKLFKDVFGKVVVDSIPKQNIQKGSQEYQGKKLKTTTFVITQEVVANFYRALAVELEKNTTLATATKKTIQYYYNNMDPYTKKEKGISNSLTQEQVNEKYNAFITECKDQAKTVTLKSDLHLSAFYNSRGKLVAREVKNVDGTLRYFMGEYQNGKQDCTEFTLTEDGSTVTAINSKTTSGGMAKGNITITTTNTSETIKIAPIRVQYSYEENAKLDGIPVFVGKVEVETEIIADQKEQNGKVKLVFENKKATNDTMNVVANLDYTIGGQTSKIGLQGILKIASFPEMKDFEIPKESTMTDQDMNEIGQKVAMKFMNALGLDKFVPKNDESNFSL